MARRVSFGLRSNCKYKATIPQRKGGNVMKVKLYATLRKATQRKEVEITLSETVAEELLKRLIDP